MLIQLFIDIGTGFSEEISIAQAVSSTTKECQIFKFDISGYRHIKNLRLDPLNNSAVIHIDKVSLVTASNEVDIAKCIQTNAALLLENNYFFSTRDPQIYFNDLAEIDLKNAQQLIVCLHYQHIGQEAIHFCQLGITNLKNNTAACKVTAIVPNYNYGRFLEQRLNSILNQTLSPCEIIFLDDGSTDNSLEIAKNILSTSRIPYQIICNSTNEGVFQQWINGVQSAKGEFIWIAEADDYCENIFLVSLLEKFMQHRQVVLAYSQSRLVDAFDNELYKTCSMSTDGLEHHNWAYDYIEDGRTEIRSCLVYRCTIPNASAVVFKKEAFAGVEELLVNYKSCGDLLAYCYMLLKGKIAYCAKVLNTFRRHGECVTYKNNNKEDYIRENIVIREFIGNYFSFSKAEISKIKHFLECDFKLEGVTVSEIPYVTQVLTQLEHKVVSRKQGAKSSKISVIMPSYNHANFIRQAIESVLSQDGIDFELLILDDASSDTTLDVISHIKDKRISFFSHKENQGAAATLNELICRASGEFIAVINSDDCWLGSDKLAHQLKIMQEKPELAACFGKAYIIDKNNQRIGNGELYHDSIFDQANRSRGKWLRYFFYFGNCLCHSTLLIRTACYKELGVYNNSLRQLHDYDLWVRLLKKYDIFVTERHLVNFRVLPGQSSSNTANNTVRTSNEHYLMASYFFAGVEQALLQDGFSDLLKNKMPKSNEQLEIEKALLYFVHNPVLGDVHQKIGILQLGKLLSQGSNRHILKDEYGIDDFWFHQKMAEIK